MEASRGKETRGRRRICKERPFGYFEGYFQIQFVFAIPRFLPIFQEKICTKLVRKKEIEQEVENKINLFPLVKILSLFQRLQRIKKKNEKIRKRNKDGGLKPQSREVPIGQFVSLISQNEAKE